MRVDVLINNFFGLGNFDQVCNSNLPMVVVDKAFWSLNWVKGPLQITLNLFANEKSFSVVCPAYLATWTFRDCVPRFHKHCQSGRFALFFNSDWYVTGFRFSAWTGVCFALSRINPRFWLFGFGERNLRGKRMKRRDDRMDGLMVGP